MVKGFQVVGLMVGITLPSAEIVTEVQNHMKDLGVHTSLSTGSTMRWMPPLVITKEQTAKVLEAFKKSREKG